MDADCSQVPWRHALLLFPGAAVPPFSPSSHKPPLVLVGISYLWYSFLWQGYTKKEVGVRWQREILVSTLLSMNAGVQRQAGMGRARDTRYQSWHTFSLGTPFPSAEHRFFFLGCSVQFAPLELQHCISEILKAGADIQPGNHVVRMGFTPPSHSSFHQRPCGVSKTWPPGVECTGELWETLLCLSGIEGEDALGHPRWKQTCRFGSSSPPRKSEPG